MSKFSELLAQRGVLLTDGATGTNLFNMGLTAGDAPEFWNQDHPDRIRKLYQGSVDAGSDLFLTNSFGANASRLKLHDAQDRAYEFSKLAAELGREVADAADREIIVAGSIGPTGEIMGDIGTLSHEDAVGMFTETAEGLLAGGADVLWVETISSAEEFNAAAEAFAKLDAPWVGTMSFDSAGRTMMGISPPKFAELVAGFDHAPEAFGANCGVGASDLLRTVIGFSPELQAVPVVAKGNAGIPKYVEGHIHYDGTPELMAEYAVLAKRAGAKIIGGCCGTMPVHLAAMRAALDAEMTETSKPSLDEIAQKLGGFSSEDDGSAGPVESKRRNRRRARE